MKATCTVCGKEYELQDGTPSANFVAEHPDRAKCFDCFKAGGTDKKAATAKAKSSTSSASKSSGDISAKDLRKAYDEVVAEFADVIPDVIQFIGGWTTTIALSNAKNKK